MKLNLLLLSAFMLFNTAHGQVLPFADVGGGNSRKQTEITRLQQTDDEKQLSVYPNPTSGIITLSLSGFNGKKTSLSVVNVIGTVIYKEVITNPNSEFTKTLDMRRNSNGLYYVKLEADDYSEIRKVILK